jgi:hypothetical protein
MKTFWIRALFTLALLVLPAALPGLRAEDLGAIKQRLAQRMPAIDALKERGVVGENNRGFLEARGALSAENTKVMSAQNADRSAAYGALAQQTGSSPDQVGRARAKKIAEKSNAGVWLQDEGGRWYRK